MFASAARTPSTASLQGGICLREACGPSHTSTSVVPLRDDERGSSSTSGTGQFQGDQDCARGDSLSLVLRAHGVREFHFIRHSRGEDDDLTYRRGLG